MKAKKKAMKKVRIYFIQTCCTIRHNQKIMITTIHSGILKNLHIFAGPRVTYIPPALPEDEDSIFAHYQTGINFDKYDDILVDLSGNNPPRAIMVRK